MATTEQLTALRKCVSRVSREAPQTKIVFQVLLAELATMESQLELLAAAQNLDECVRTIVGLLELVNGLQACVYEGITDPAAMVH